MLASVVGVVLLGAVLVAAVRDHLTASDWDWDLGACVSKVEESVSHSFDNRVVDAVYPEGMGVDFIESRSVTLDVRNEEAHPLRVHGTVRFEAKRSTEEWEVWKDFEAVVPPDARTPVSVVLPNTAEDGREGVSIEVGEEELTGFFSERTDDSMTCSVVNIDAGPATSAPSTRAE